MPFPMPYRTTLQLFGLRAAVAVNRACSREFRGQAGLGRHGPRAEYGVWRM